MGSGRATICLPNREAEEDNDCPNRKKRCALRSKPEETISSHSRSRHAHRKGIPPIGSLITVDKKHAIVTAIERNQLTVFVDGNLKTIVCKPGQIKWHSDKVLLSAVQGK